MFDKIKNAAAAMGGFEDILSGKDMLKNGASGGAVEMLQSALSKAGFDAGGVDGKFGPLTQKAVEMFQAKMGLKTDGVVGPETGGKLQDMIKGALGDGGLAEAAGGLFKGMGK